MMTHYFNDFTPWTFVADEASAEPIGTLVTRKPVAPTADELAERSFCRPSGSRTNSLYGGVTQNNLLVTADASGVTCTSCLKKLAARKESR